MAIENDRYDIRTVFEPIIQEYGLTLTFEDNDETQQYQCRGRLEAEDFFVYLKRETASYGHSLVLNAGLALKKGKAMRAYSEDLWTVACEDRIELSEIQRMMRVPFWRLGPRVSRNNTYQVNLQTLTAFRDNLEKLLTDPLNGNLTKLFELQKKRVLLPVYTRIKQPAEEWAAKNKLSLSYMASGSEWNIIAMNDAFRIGVKLHVSETDIPQFQTSAAFGTIQNGEFNHLKEVKQLTNIRAPKSEHYQHCRDYGKTRWKVDRVADQLERFINVLDKYAGDILCGETPFDTIIWLPDSPYM